MKLFGVDGSEVAGKPGRGVGKGGFGGPSGSGGSRGWAAGQRFVDQEAVAVPVRFVRGFVRV